VDTGTLQFYSFICTLPENQAGPYGLGYEKISKITNYFNEIDISKDDIQKSINSLTLKGLIENDFHSKKYLEIANAIRITSTGIYYSKFMTNKFVYLDLMLQETPIFDHEVFIKINPLAESTVMDERILRCNLFINYLTKQEENELIRIKKYTKDPTLNWMFMPRILHYYESNVIEIREKLNRKGIY